MSEQVGRYGWTYFQVQPQNALASVPAFPFKLDWKLTFNNATTIVDYAGFDVPYTYSFQEKCENYKVGHKYVAEKNASVYVVTYDSCGYKHAYAQFQVYHTDYVYRSSGWANAYYGGTPAYQYEYVSIANNLPFLPQSVQARLVATSADNIVFGGSGAVDTPPTPYSYQYNQCYNNSCWEYSDIGTYNSGYASGIAQY